MSSLAYGLVGAVVGFYIGGPTGAQMGFAAGSYIGASQNATDTKVIGGPRLTDTKVQNSTVGIDLPVIFNHSRLAGNVIWSTALKETAHEHDTGGKGASPLPTGAGSTTYTYAVDTAIAICQGPGVQLKKIWANGKLIYDVDNGGGSDTFSFHDGSETQTADSYIQGIEGSQYVCAYRGTAYIVFQNFQLEAYGNMTPNFEFEVYVPFDSLGSIVRYLCKMSGMQDSQFDTSALTDICDGYKISNRGTIRQALEPLAQAYYFDSVESNGVIKFVKRGSTTVAATISEDDLDARDSGAGPGTLLSTIRAMEMELPYEVVVLFMDINNSFQQGQQYARRLNTQSKSQVKIELPMTLKASDAFEIANTVLNAAWVSRTTLQFTTGKKHAYLEPTDVIIVIKGGIQRGIRLISKEESAPGIISWKAEAEDAGLWNYTAPTSLNVVNAPEFYAAKPGSINTYAVFDAPQTNASTGCELILAACGSSADWGGCRVWLSLDGASYNPIGIIRGPSTMGVTTTSIAAIADPDNTSALGVDLSSSFGQLYTVSQQASDAGVSACYVGGEIISYKTAALTSAFHYTLSNLHRGDFATPVASHTTGVPFIAIDSGVLKYAYAPWLVGATVHLKFTSFNTHFLAEEDIAAVPAHDYTLAGPVVQAISSFVLATPWTGRDSRVKWGAVLGADNYTLVYKHAGVTLRTITGLTALEYTYTFEDMLADTAGAVVRTLDITITAKGLSLSQTTATLSISNPQIPAPTAVTSLGALEGFTISCAKPADPDYAGCAIYASQTSGFTTGTLIYDGLDTNYGLYGLTAGDDWYIKIGCYDIFGKDNMVLSSEQHVVIRGVTSSPSATLAAINTILSAGTGQLEIVPGSFAVKSPTSDLYPFAVVDTGGGSYKTLLNSDVLIGGNVSIANLTSGALPSDVILSLGGGTIQLDGMGEIRVYAGTGDNQDFVDLTSANISFKHYIAGTGYVTYNYLSRIEVGTANNGDTVIIPGYWKQQPKVMVAPASLGVYKTAYANQDQALLCQVLNLQEVVAGSMRWQFQASASLILASGGGSTSVGTTSGELVAGSTWTSGTVTTPNNCNSVTPSVTVVSNRWSGSGALYAYRQVRWRVRYTGDSGGGSFHTTSIGAQLGAVVDSYTFNFPSSSAWTYWLEFIGEDSSGTFTPSVVPYDYSTGSTSNPTAGGNNAFSKLGDTVTTTVTMALPGYTPPAGWSIVSTAYSYTVTGYTAPTGSGTVYINTPAGVIAANGAHYSSVNYTGYPSFTGSGYNPNACTAYGSASGTGGNGWSCNIKMVSASASITISRPQFSGTYGSNTFTFGSYGYVLSAYSVLATGTLNWQAMGQ